MPRGRPFLDLTNKRFGRLIALERVGQDEKRHAFWRCICDCGTEVTVRAGVLSQNRKLSCGCLWEDAMTKHGMTRTPEFTVWVQMRQRCGNPNHPRFKDYGGRGITVCERWQRFEGFIADMGARPNSRATIERVDNDKGYSPENCVWLDKSLQNRNRRRLGKKDHP